jgi:hypothetical protein
MRKSAASLIALPSTCGALNPRESQRSDLAESLKMPRVAPSCVDVASGLSDTTVVDKRYIRFFMHRNKPNSEYLIIKNQ